MQNNRAKAHQQNNVIMILKTLTSKIEDTYKVVGIKGKNEILYNIYSFVYNVTMELHITINELQQIEVELVQQTITKRKIHYKEIVTPENLEDVLTNIDMCL